MRERAANTGPVSEEAQAQRSIVARRRVAAFRGGNSIGYVLPMQLRRATVEPDVEGSA